MADDGDTIMWIENGHVTGRRVGGPPTNLGLEALQAGKANPDRYDYRSVLTDGRVLRSSSVYFRDSTGELMVALCINLDITDLLIGLNALATLVGDAAATDGEVFGTNIDDLLKGIIASVVATIGMTPEKLSRSERVAFVRLLDEKGAFQVKRAIEVVSQTMGLSRATIYAYLDEARSLDPPEPIETSADDQMRSPKKPNRSRQRCDGALFAAKNL